jgi:hypothetical protein
LVRSKKEFLREVKIELVAASISNTYTIRPLVRIKYEGAKFVKEEDHQYYAITAPPLYYDGGARQSAKKIMAEWYKSDSPVFWGSAEPVVCVIKYDDQPPEPLLTYCRDLIPHYYCLASRLNEAERAVHNNESLAIGINTIKRRFAKFVHNQESLLGRNLLAMQGF